MTPAPAGGPGPILVVGVGNALMTDDGVGLAALARLEDEWSFGPGVELVDGGAWALSLVPQVEDASALLLIDAIEAGEPAGAVIELEGHEIPRFLGTRLSPHQMGVRDLLALCTLRGGLPSRTAALGIQAFIIMGGVSGLIPLTGITLPFVSYGGSSIVANFIILALLLMVSDRVNRERA